MCTEHPNHWMMKTMKIFKISCNRGEGFPSSVNSFVCSVVRKLYRLQKIDHVYRILDMPQTFLYEILVQICYTKFGVIVPLF